MMMFFFCLLIRLHFAAQSCKDFCSECDEAKSVRKMKQTHTQKASKPTAFELNTRLRG